jgi:hypothetical protein
MKKNITPRLVTLSRSNKPTPEGTRLGELNGNKRLRFSVQMATNATVAQIAAIQEDVTAGRRPHLTNAELVQLFGESRSHRRRVYAGVKAHGLKVIARSASDKMFGVVQLEGTYAAAKKFMPGLKLSLFKDSKGEEFIGREGTISVKANLPVVGVYGLDTRDVAHTNVHLAGKTAKPSAIPSGLTSRGLAKLQGFDFGMLDSVADVVTGYISLGGDNGKKMQADAGAAAKHDGIALANIVGISVDGTPVDGGAAGYRDGATVENALDLQAHVLINPNGHCLVFRADNSDDAFARAYESAVAYTGLKLADGRVLKLRSVTISWGMAESGNTAQSLERWARAAAAGRLKGLVTTAATGDNGSRDNTASPTPDAPSCVPGIIGAAGFGIRSTNDSTVSARYVWPDTGGGISETFPLIAEEKDLGLPVSADTKKPGHSASLIADVAAPECGPFVRYMARFSQVGGTSHAAPAIGIKMAKLLKKLEDEGIVISDPYGFVYENLGKGILDMVTEAGSNGDYDAKPGDVINVPVGGGSINEEKFLAVARAAAKAA